MADGNFLPGDVPEKLQVEGDKDEGSVIGMLRHLVEVTADMMDVPWDCEDRQSRTDFANDGTGAEGEGHSIVCPPPSSEEPPGAELSADIANGTGISQENMDADLTRAEATGEEWDAKNHSGAAETVCKKSHSKSSVSAYKNEARSVSSDTTLFIGKQDDGLSEDASEVDKRRSGSKEDIQGKMESTENLQSCESKDTEELIESLRKLMNFQQTPCLNATEREVEIETPILKVTVSQDPVTSTPELEDEVKSGYEEDNCDGKSSIPECTDGSIEYVHLEEVEPNETKDDQVVDCCAQNPTVPEVRIAPGESQNIAVIEFSIPPESRTQSLESPDMRMNNSSDSAMSAEPDDDVDSISTSMHNRDFRYWWERNNNSYDLGNLTFTVAIRKLNFPMERVLRAGETKQESSRKAEVRKLRYPWNEQQHPPINDTTILNDFPEVVQELESAKENSDVTPPAETITFSSPDPQTDSNLPNKLEPFEVINPSDSWSSFGPSELLNPERFSVIQQSETVAEPEDVTSTPEDHVMDFTWENYGPATLFNSIPFPSSPLDPDLVEHLAQITGMPLIHALNPVNCSSSCEEIIDINFDTITADATSAVYDIETDTTGHIEQEYLQQFVSEEWDPKEDDMMSAIENELIEITEVGEVENQVIDICNPDEQITARDYADTECKTEKEGSVKIAKEKDYSDDDGDGESEETVDDDSEVIYECSPENFRTAVIVAQNMETNILNILNGLMQTQMLAERVRNDAELSAHIDKELNARKEELNHVDDSGTHVTEESETPETISTEIGEYIPQLEDTDIALDHVGDSETEKIEEEEEREVLEIKASEGDFGDRHSFDSKVDKCCTEVLPDEVIDKEVTQSKTELNALEKLLITEDFMKELQLDSTVSEYDDEQGEDIVEGIIGEYSPENVELDTTVSEYDDEQGEDIVEGIIGEYSPEIVELDTTVSEYDDEQGEDIVEGIIGEYSPENVELDTTVSEYDDEQGEDIVEGIIGEYSPENVELDTTVSEYDDEQGEDIVEGIIGEYSPEIVELDTTVSEYDDEQGEDIVEGIIGEYSPENVELDTTVSEYDDEQGEDIVEGIIGEYSPENLHDFKQMVEEYQKLVDNVCYDIKEEMVKQSDVDNDEGISSSAEEAVQANMGEIDGQTSAVSDPCEASSQGTACQVNCLNEYQTGPIPSVSDGELKLCEEDEGEATSLQDSMEMSMLQDSVNIEDNSVSVRASTSLLSSDTLEGFIIRGTQRIPSDMRMETFSLTDSVQESFSRTNRVQHCEANTVGKSTSDGPSGSGVKVKSLTEKDNRTNASSGTKSCGTTSAEIGSTESTESYQEPINIISQKSDYTCSKLELVPITPKDFANAMENILEYVQPEFQIVQETSSGVKRTKCKLSDVQDREKKDISHPTDEKETRMSKPVETLANMNDSDIKVNGEDSFPSNEEDTKIEVAKTTEACQREPNVSDGEERKIIQSMMGSLEIDQTEKVEKEGISPVQEETTETSATPQTYEKKLDGSLPIESDMHEKETEEMDGYLEECENTKGFAKGDEKIEGIDVFQLNDEDSKDLNQPKVSDKINEYQPELPVVADEPEFANSSIVIQNNASSQNLNSEGEHQSTVTCLLETNNITFLDKARLKVISNTNQVKLQEFTGESQSNSVHLPGATASYDSEVTEPESRLQNEEMLTIMQMKNPKMLTDIPEITLNGGKSKNIGKSSTEVNALTVENQVQNISQQHMPSSIATVTELDKFVEVTQSEQQGHGPECIYKLNMLSEESCPILETSVIERELKGKESTAISKSVRDNPDSSQRSQENVKELVKNGELLVDSESKDKDRAAEHELKENGVKKASQSEKKRADINEPKQKNLTSLRDEELSVASQGPQEEASVNGLSTDVSTGVIEPKLKEFPKREEPKQKGISGLIQPNEIKVLTRTELKGEPEQGTAAVETANQMEKLSKATQPKQNDHTSEEINPKQNEKKGENLFQTKIEERTMDREQNEKEISAIIQSIEEKVLTRTELKGEPEQGTAAAENANQMVKLSKATQPKQNGHASEEINPKQNETKGENLGQTKIEERTVDSELKEKEISAAIQSNEVKVPTRTVEGEPEQGTAVVETANQMENLSKAAQPKQNYHASEEINPKQNETKGEDLGQTKIEEGTVDSERKEKEISGVIQSNEVKVPTRTELKEEPEQGTAAVETANQMEKLCKATQPKGNDYASEEINPKQNEKKGENLGQTKVEECTVDTEQLWKDSADVHSPKEIKSKLVTKTKEEGFTILSQRDHRELLVVDTVFKDNSLPEANHLKENNSDSVAHTQVDVDTNCGKSGEGRGSSQFSPPDDGPKNNDSLANDKDQEYEAEEIPCPYVDPQQPENLTQVTDGEENM